MFSPLRRSAAVLVLALTVSGCTATADLFNDPPAATTATTTATTPAATTATLTASSAPAATAATAATAGSALAAVQALPVKGRAPRTGYDRDQFGQAWTDDVDVPLGHNGCDTRSDILRRDLQDVTIKPSTHGCVPLTGTLHDPYTGDVIAWTRGADTSAAVQIDHVVALGDAWQTGAQQLTATQRQDLANDPLNLLAVDGPTNQGKGDSDAASWLPPEKSYRCAYVARQVAVKTKYQLWVTSAEQAAMVTVLSTCPDQALPAEAGSDTDQIGG